MMNDLNEVLIPVPSLDRMEKHIDNDLKYDKEDRQWDDWEEDIGQGGCIVGFTNEERFSSVKSFLDGIKERHNIDLVRILNEAVGNQCREEKMYMRIKLINYLRMRSISEGWTVNTKVGILDDSWKDEKYLKPVLEDDELLYMDWNDVWNENPDEDTVVSSETSRFIRNALREKDEQIKILQERLSSVVKLNKVLMEDENVKKKFSKPKKIAYDFYKGSDLSPDDGYSSSSSSDQDLVDVIDSHYFGVYNGFEIHEDMLKDRARTGTYRDFLTCNSFLYENKLIMDVGCGTGILSLIMAKGGARSVIAIDASKIIDYAHEIACENQLEKKIIFVKTKAENMAHLPREADADGKVDFIISEWMGYALLFEAMLPSVIMMRDRWLKKGGYVFPDVVSLKIQGYSAPEYVEEKIDFWKDVYGFSMEPIAKKIYKEASINHMGPYRMITDTCMFWSCDCHTVKVEDMYFNSMFELVAKCDEKLDAFVLHFDVNFTRDARFPFAISTSPQSPKTHWGQTVLLLHDEIHLKTGDKINGKISYIPNIESFRSLDIKIQFHLNDNQSHTYSAVYTLT